MTGRDIVLSQKITLHIKNIPAIIIVTAEGLVNYFSHLTLFQSHNLVVTNKISCNYKLNVWCNCLLEKNPNDSFDCDKKRNLVSRDSKEDPFRIWNHRLDRKMYWFLLWNAIVINYFDKVGGNFTQNIMHNLVRNQILFH